MATIDLLEGISSVTYATSRLRTHALQSSGSDAPVVFLHGSLSSARFFEETLAALPARYRGIAPDLRGYGHSESIPVNATRGVRDFSDDLCALLTSAELGLGGAKVHLCGWSLGGGVAMQYAVDHPAAIASLTLVSPISPYGFGGTKDALGMPAWPDFAGSGGGMANPGLVERLADGDHTGEHPMSPRNVLCQFYFRPPFRPTPEREDLLVAEILAMVIGDDNYPGDMSSSANWPGVAPGTRGVNNAISPRYFDLDMLVDMDPKPDILWIRGADDQVVSNSSRFDFGYLGQLGAVPAWPGEDEFPPQPMIDQTRAVLETYRARGGSYREEVLAGVGHSPHIEAPERFMKVLLEFLARAG